MLGRFSDEELSALQPRIDLAVDIVKSFVLAGIDITMNQYNKLGKKGVEETPNKENSQQND